MKIEHGSFMATDAVTTVILNDSTITPNRMIFWVDGDYSSHGYDDLSQQICAYNAPGNTKDDKSIYVYNGSTVLLSGKATAFYLGEFDVTFDTRTTRVVSFAAIED